MGAVNYGFFFFLLSKILSVNCLPNNPPNSIPNYGQNVPAPNSWTGQPVQSVLQGMTNIFDAMNPNPSQNTYVDNNNNQQNIKYNQQYSTSQPYNSAHYNYNQQYPMSQSNNEPSHNYEQQSIVLQPYNAQPYNSEQQFSKPSTYNAPTHNYQQQSSVNQPLYNLYSPTQSNGQKNSQSFGTIGTSLKEYQKQLPSSINQPIEVLTDFGQPINNDKNQENIQRSSPPISSIPNQSQLSQMPSKLSKPTVKGSSTSNGYNIDIKEAELPNFGQPNNNAKKQNIIPQSSPPISSIPNQPQLSQMPSKLSKPTVKGSSTSNGYNIDIKEAELPDFGQPISNAENQGNKPSSAPSFTSNPNQFQLSKPIVKDTFTPNGYDIEIKKEVPDFGQPISNAKNQEKIQQSSPSNAYDTEIKEVPGFDQVIYNAENQGNKPSSAPSFTSNPNQFQLSKPIVKDTFTPNGYDIEIKKEVPDFGQPISNAKNQEKIQQSSPSNAYDTEIKEVPGFDQVIYNAENQGNKPSSAPSFTSNPNQFQLSKPIVKDTFTPNGYDIEIKKEVPDFGQPISNAKNQEKIQQSSPSNAYDTEIKEVPDFDQVIYNAENQGNKPSSAPSFPSIQNQSKISQIPSQSSSKPFAKGSLTPNENTMQITNDNMSLNSLLGLPDGQSEPLTNDFVQNEDVLIDNAENQGNKPSSAPSFPSISNQFQLSKPIVKETFTPNGYDIEIKEEVPYLDKPINNSKNQENIQQSSPSNEYETEIKEVPDFDQVIYNAENQGNKPSPAPSFPPNSNQSKISQIPSQSSSKPFAKGSLTPNENTMQIKNDNMSLNSLLGLPDGQSEPLTNDFVQNEDVLIDNSQTDIQSFLNSENYDILNPSNNVLENQDDSQLVINDVPSQLPTNVQAANVIIDPQSNDLISNMDLNDDTKNLQNTLNKDLLPADFEDTELNEESKLENAISESSVFALNDTNTKDDILYSLENIIFDVPPLELDRLSNYDSSYIVDTENPKNAKEDNAKITVYANPNDVHILQLSPKQSSTNDNSYIINNNLLNTPSTGMPLWYSSFPNGADYVQHFNSNTNKQLSDSLLNFNQNLAYNQIPMYLENSNYYNKQAAVDQNQMKSKIQSPGLSLDDNQPSSMDNSGSIYKKVDLKNPPPNSSNSWSLLKKDYTKNLRPNQNDRYTSGDGTTRTSFIGAPLSSYQNSNQGILNLPSNDMFIQNMISVISNSVQAPLDGTKAIFDVTSANFPRSSVNHIIRLTHAIVRSVMLNLRQTLNTFMKTLYGRRVKRDVSPFEVLHNLPGALVNKYSLQSTAAPTTKNTNSPYYKQPTTAGQQQTADYFKSQPATENMLGQQQTYGNEIDRNYYGSQDDNIRLVPQPASTQNYVLNSLIDAITSAVRSNVPAPYSIDSPEVKQYTQQVIVTAEIVFKNQIDNILHGQLPTLNMY